MPEADRFPIVAVVGAGAVGCYFGAMLARSGVHVRLIGRAPLVAAVARDGLVIDGLHIRERIPIEATASMAEGVQDADVILFCVKTVHTELAARQMLPFLAPKATILSLQNGVDNPERIYAAIQARAIPVVVYVAAEMTAPGHVTHTGRGDLIIGQRGKWPLREDLNRLAAMFEQAAVPCRISDDIAAEMWTKMAMNCAYNALSALTRAQYGRMMQSTPLREFVVRLIQETVAVARSQGVLLSEQDMIQAALRLGEAMSGATSSMAQDIARGRSTEIDSLNGYVVRQGASLEVATPANATLVAMVKLLQESARNGRSD